MTYGNICFHRNWKRLHRKTNTHRRMDGRTDKQTHQPITGRKHFSITSIWDWTILLVFRMSFLGSADSDGNERETRIFFALHKILLLLLKRQAPQQKREKKGHGNMQSEHWIHFRLTFTAGWGQMMLRTDTTPPHLSFYCFFLSYGVVEGPISIDDNECFLVHINIERWDGGGKGGRVPT